MHNFELVNRQCAALMTRIQAAGQWQVTHAG
ncbi:hypothetical protein B5717_09055 [Aeromonas hydrophila]|uniref:Uncharacterized protein n=1 Tax=Aeromonas hydrophila TaxID=644 RepID=A0ABD7G6T9_AERHY|nr:hypothetical protein AHML_08950 [Aeromonas hydrophila ML09-119]AUZ75656.1 hypothetical protein C2U40_13070 [Aeromonas sp. ASNIH4]MBC6395144.1 hypothetical protein [Aeromonas hydrophila]POV89048.1 hypothetical protein C3395_09185 [Aeromonas sp. ASNIH6]ORJ68103.1 hypothetical protein B5717_09055 [Aeromonas hydrophila]